MILHLDTHIVVWLYAGKRSLFPARTAAALARARLVYSPIVGLELSYLYEIGRITVPARTILEYLSNRIDLVVDDTPYAAVTKTAEELSWTRDPFDRLITAAAATRDRSLVTRDRTIRDNYPHAFWDDSP